MKPHVSYCAASHEDTTFVARYDAYSYRWTNACPTGPEHEPAYIRNAVLHVLAYSASTDSPFLAILILTACEDTPRKTQSILFHSIVHFSSNQLKFIPTIRRLCNNLNTTLRQATDHPTYMVIIANKEGQKRNTYTPPASNICLSPASYNLVITQLKQSTSSSFTTHKQPHQ